jgi:glycosyl hydrolase family 12
MKHLALLAVLALMAVAGGPGAAAADSRGTARACHHPRYVTSDPDGMWFHGRYVVHNNMWNASGYDVSERLRACSPGNWSVRAIADNRSGDGAVKTYPNVHRDYHNWNTGHEPRIAAFRSIRSTFASRSPHVGIYDGAYDIWLNGVADGDSIELMIWTDNHHQVPAGRPVKKGLTFSHRTWKLWATPDRHYLAFVPNKPLGHGTIALKQRFSYLMRHGFVPRDATLGQVCFGYEIVSTGGSPASFKVDRFSVTSSRR